MSRAYPPSNRQVALRISAGVIVGGLFGVLLGRYGFDQGWSESILTLLPVVVVLAVVMYVGSRH